MITKLAFLNLFRNKRRTLSTGLAICIGFVGLNLLGAYIYRVKKALDTTSVYSALHGHVKVYKKDSLINFSLQSQQYIIHQPELQQIRGVLEKFKNEIEYVGYNLNGSGLLSNGNISHPIMYLSFEPEVYAKSLSQPDMREWAQDWVLPAQFENVEIFKNNNEVISLTPKIVDILNLKYPLAKSESLQLAGRTLDGDLNAVNVDLGAEHTTGMQFMEDTLILVPFKKSQELMSTDGAESLSIYLTPKASLLGFQENLERELAKLDFQLETFPYWDERINSVYLGTIGFLVVMGAFFVFLIGTAVSLSIVNSLTMGIIERTREIGTLYAVGFKRRDVSKLFILENLFLCLLSILFGVLISYIVSSFINGLNIRFTPPGVAGKIQFKLVWNFAIAFSVASFTLTLTMLSSWFVMQNKSKVKLINLLNDTGS